MEGVSLVVMGGRDHCGYFDDTFILDMPSLTWSSIEGMVNPQVISLILCFVMVLIFILFDPLSF